MYRRRSSDNLSLFNDEPEADLDEVLQLDKRSFVAAVERLKSSESVSVIRRMILGLKQELRDPGARLRSTTANDDVVEFTSNYLNEELDQIASSHTLERALHYVERLVKSVTETRVSEINDVNLNRWKECEDGSLDIECALPADPACSLTYEPAPEAAGQPTPKIGRKSRKMTAMSQPMQVLTSQQSVEWYTPPQYVEMVREVVGDIDLDPASSETPQSWIRAKTYWTVDDDGLSRRWFGRVFLNPPYPAGEWTRYMIEQWERGNLKPSIALVNANLGYAWFEELWTRYPVCFAKERIFFVRQDGKGFGQSKKASAFVYFGDSPFRFGHTFNRIGRVIMP